MTPLEQDRPFGPWAPRLTRGPVRLIAPDELRAWILYEDERLLVLNKPGDVVCHPSKAGPWSSLVGAAREYLGLPAVHLIFRLDRETSGAVVLAKEAGVARRLQLATQERRYGKTYLALLFGELAAASLVDQPLVDHDLEGPVYLKSKIAPQGEGHTAITHIAPLTAANGFTLARVETKTGRKHQIRAHAQWLGYPLVGDKIYGPDARLFLQFIETGWTPALAAKLLLARQALHCAEIDLRAAGESHVFRAPLPDDMKKFLRERMGCNGELTEIVRGLDGKIGLAERLD